VGKQPKRAPVSRKADTGFSACLDRYFWPAEQGIDVRTEFIAGVTTFLTMVYIAFVNPIILGKTGNGSGRGLRCNVRRSRGQHSGHGLMTAITMPLTYSIATGIGLGYALAKIISGKVREASSAVIVLAVLFATKFAVTG